MKYTKDILDKLNVDMDFQNKIHNDKQLNDAFYSTDVSKSMELKELSFILGAKMVVGSKIFDPPSLWWLATLGILESPLVSSKKTTSLSDIDMAMWLIATGMEGVGMLDSDIEDQCLGYCASVEMDYKDAYMVLTQYIDLSLQAFTMFPDCPIDRDSFKIDTHWVVSLAAKASLMSGIPADRILKSCPIPMVAHLCVTCAERDGHKGIGHRKKNQVVIERLNALMDQHIKSKGW